MIESMSLNINQRGYTAIGRIAVIVFAALIVAALILVIGMKGLGTSGLRSQTAAAVAQEQPPQQLVKLRANGFVESEVSRAGGQFALVIELGKDFRNEEITVQVKRSDGSVVTEVQIAEGIPVQSQDVNLQSGQYTLEVVNHPQWVCQLTVQ